MAGESSAKPDLDWIERFGAVFEWNAIRHREMDRAFRRAVKRKQIVPTKQKPGRFYRFFYALTVVGVLTSVPILLTLSRQTYFESGSNLTAGAILGATAVGCVFWTHALIAFRQPWVADPRWVYTMIRVGVDVDTLWIYKHGTISIFATRDAFFGVKRFEHFICAYVSPHTAHHFPIDVLEQTGNGRRVLDWFEAHWPSDVASTAPGRDIPRGGLVRRVSRGLVRLLCVVGIGLILIEALSFLGSGSQDAVDAAKRPRVDAPVPNAVQEGDPASPVTPPDQASVPPPLSGPGATRFVDHLVHPGAP